LRAQRVNKRGRGLALLLWLCGAPALFASTLDCPPAPPTASIAKAPYASPYDHGLLWELRGPNGAVSHLYGTIHLATPAITAVTPQVQALLAASRRFGMEVLLEPAALQAVAASVIASPGKGLGDRAPPALRDRVLALLAPYGVDAASALRLKPWAAWTTLALPPDEHGTPLDLVLMHAAEAAGVSAFGIETLAEQTALFDGLSPADELALLTDAACHYEQQSAERQALIAAWLRADLGALYRLSLDDDSPLQQRLMARVLHARNQRMAQRLLPQFAQGGAFVAVGALHLPGANGLLARFKAAGYTLRALD
jgi:uncharacterized protein YbaP (TraB family)